MESNIRKILEKIEPITAKGIGKNLGKISTPLGLTDAFEGSAILLRDWNGFNVLVMSSHIIINGAGILLKELPSNYEPRYLFSQPVSEEEARRAYRGLDKPQ